MTSLLLLVTCLVATSAALQSDWNQDMRNYVLKIHNDYRRNEGACQMNKLEYDMDLENQAKFWAEGCVFKHELKDGRGENLAWDSSRSPEKELIKDSAQRWFDEKNLYSYGRQASCGSACHYTQLVWDTTEKVGCWSTRCPNLRYAYTDAWYLVCFYTPMGNWHGEKPYEKTCDAPCRPGQTEEDGMCAGKAVEGGGQGAGGDGKDCSDSSENCSVWADSNQCQANPSWMNKNCPLSCGVCTKNGGESEDKKSQEDCKDGDTRCPRWAEDNQCTYNPSYMLKNCKLSCGVCSESGDAGTGGGSDAGSESGATDNSGGAGEEKEKESSGGDKGGDAGGCGGSSSGNSKPIECKDDNANCPLWAQHGFCKRQSGYMRKHCKKACKTCGGQR